MEERKDMVTKIVDILVEHWVKYTDKMTRLVVRQFITQFPDATLPASNKAKHIREFQEQLGSKYHSCSADSKPSLCCHIDFSGTFSAFRELYSMLRSNCNSRGWMNLVKLLEEAEQLVQELVDADGFSIAYEPLAHLWNKYQDKLGPLCISFATVAKKYNKRKSLEEFQQAFKKQKVTDQSV